MGILDWLRGDKKTVSGYQMVTTHGDSFFAYNGNLYQSDIVRSCIRPKAQAVGKAVAKHIRDDPKGGLAINPDAYMRFLLEEPNEFMTGQLLQEKLTTQLMLNGNAFALIIRDDNGFPQSIYPVDSTGVEAIRSSGNLYLRFTMRDGKNYTFRYADLIHLRRDFNGSDLFGDSPANSLVPLMEIVTTTDQGIVKAIKNSNIIRWLLKFNQSMRDDDLEKQRKNFVKSYLTIENDDVPAGAAAVDARMDAQQVEPKDYVPNAAQSDRTVQRLFSAFNTNTKIVQSAYTEDEWISYYEAEIEPVVAQLSGEFTRKLFSRRQRGFGNRIMFEGSNLAFASIKTKIGLVQLVDRGIMNPDEVRETMNYAPVPDGEGKKFIRRLDTQTIEQQKGGDKE